MGLKDLFSKSDNKYNTYKPVTTKSNGYNVVKNETSCDSNNNYQGKELIVQDNISANFNFLNKDKSKETDNTFINKTEHENLDKKDKGFVSSFWNKDYKETVKKTLYIFLIEDTAEMVKHNDDVHIAYEAIPKDSLVCFIHYGEILYNSGILINSQKVRRRISLLY